MARSRRKTPIFGITNAESDKPFKVREHRRHRSSVRQALRSDADVPHEKMFGNPWAAPKDGKQWIGDKYPHLMRK